MERDGLAPTLIMTTGLQRPEVLQASTDAYAVTRVRTARSSRIGKPVRETHPLHLANALGWIRPSSTPLFY
jgi:hypothetical protein